MWALLLLIFVGVFLFFKFVVGRESYWEKNGVRHIETSTLFEKLLLLVGKRSLADFDNFAYKEMAKTGLKFIGTIEVHRPLLIVRDFEVMKNILIRDFGHFVDRPMVFSNRSQEIINKMLPNLRGDEWKCARSLLSPSFGIGRIRRMMECFDRVSREWMQHFEDDLKKSGTGSLTISVLHEANNFAVDVLAATAFGMNSGTVRNPNSYFSRMVHKLSNFSIGNIIRLVLSNGMPQVLDFFGLHVFEKESFNFFSTLFKGEIKMRAEGTVKRNDFLQLFVDARRISLSQLMDSEELSEFEKNAQLQDIPKNKIDLVDEKFATAQAVIFFMAGFFPSGSNIALIIYELAANPDVQRKLREEVNANLFEKSKGDVIDHDVLNSLPYLEMIFCETLRRYAPMERIERVCTKDYYDPVNNLRVPEGAVVSIPVYSIHHDKQYYEHPDKFYPEHFSPENKAKRSNYSFLPFGYGARNCIGMRFTTVSSKAAVAHLVHNFVIESSPETPIPVKVDSFGIGVHAPEHLKLVLRPAKNI